MEIEEMKKYLEDGLSLNRISKETGKSLTTIRYWAKKHGLKSNYVEFNIKDYGTHRDCPRCKKSVLVDEFYSRRNKENSSTYCRRCTSDQVLERVRKFKSMMIEYKGGKCVRCGYDRYQGALEFHHIDPSKKDFTLSRLKMNKFDDRVRGELDKCILVCSNCHREIHNEIMSEKEV